MKDVKFTYLGKIENNKTVGCIDIYDFYQTNGLPIAMQVDKLWECNVVVSWLHEYNLALWNGVKEDKFLSILQEELSFSKYYNKQEVLDKLNIYIKQREKPSIFNYNLLIESKKIAEIV